MPLFYHHRAQSYFLRVFLKSISYDETNTFFFFLATVKIQNIILTKKLRYDLQTITAEFCVIFDYSVAIFEIALFYHFFV